MIKWAAYKVNKVLPFQVFEALELPKFLTFFKRDVWVLFHQAGGLQNEQNLLFQVFRASKHSKATAFVKRGVCTCFHQAGSLQIEQACCFKIFERYVF